MDGLGGINLLAYASATSLKYQADSSSSAGNVNHDASSPRRWSSGWHHGRHVHHGHHAHRGHVHSSDSAPTQTSAATESAPAQSDAAASARLTYRRTDKAAIYIQTQEGDTVALKIKSRDAVAAEVGNGSSGDTPSTELTVAGSSSTKVAIFVHGNLNADELAAVQNVVDQAAALSDQFFSGDTQGAFAAAANLNVDASQLAKVGLRLSVREQATYAAIANAQPAAGQTSTASAASTDPAAASASPAPNVSAAALAAAPPAETSTDPTSTSPAADPQEPTALPAASTADPSPSDSTVPATPTASTDVAAILGTVANFLHQLLDALSPPPADTASTHAQSSSALDFSLKINIFQSILLTVSSNEPATGTTTDAAAGAAAAGAAADSPAEAPADAGSAPVASPTATGLLSDTLDAIAAQRQPPLDAVA